MSKRLRGLYKDTLPIDQPEGFYSHAENINLNMDIGSVSTEEGIEQITDSIPNGFTPLAYETSPDKRIIIWYVKDNTSGIGVLHNKSFNSILEDDKLNFSKDNAIHTTSRLSKDGEFLIYWTDGVNPPRFANIDDIPMYSSVDEFNIFPTISSPLYAYLSEVEDSGGSLLSGAYQFAIAYYDENDSRTNYVVVTNPIYIGDSLQGFLPDTPTSKSIEISISNIDTRYKSMEIAAIHYSSGTISSVKILPRIGISSTQQNYIYSGQESFIDGSIDDIVIDSTFYDTAKCLIQHDGNLYLANLTRATDIGYQRYANNIEIERIDSTLPDGESYGDRYSFAVPMISYENKTYQREQVYAFYISFILKNGSQSYAYHIPGREAEGNELDALDSGSSDPNEVRLESIDNEAKQFHYNAQPGSNGMAYWENKQELYPDTDDYDVYDVNGNGEGVIHATKSSLRKKKVRHHRFPEIAYSNHVDDEGNVSIVGLRLKNIKIPSDIKKKVIGFKIYYAKRNQSDSLVLGHSLLLPQTTNTVDDVDYYSNNVPLYNETGTINAIAFAVHPFSLLKNNSSIGALTHIKCYSQAGNNNARITKPSATSSTNAASGTFYPINYLDKTDNDRIRTISKKSYIASNIDIVTLQGLGFARNKRSIKEESQILLELSEILNRDYDTGNVVNTTIDYSWLATLHSHKTELYNSFDQQELIWTGFLEKDLDKYDPTHVDYDGGSLSTGSITITSGSTSSASTVDFTVDTGNLGSCEDPFTHFDLTINFDGIETIVEDIAIGADIGIAVISIVNALNLDHTNWTFAPVSNGDDIIIRGTHVSPGDNNGLTLTAVVSNMTGGVEICSDSRIPQATSGDSTGGSSNGQPEGTIEFSINGVVELSYDVIIGDSALTVANGLSDYLIANSSRYTSIVTDLGGGEARIDIESINPSPIFDGNIVESENSSTITYSSVDLSGGSYPSSSTDSIFGGDTFIGFYGYRVTQETDEKKLMIGMFIESQDNVTNRANGNEHGQLNPNILTNWSNILDYEEDDTEDNEVWYDNYYGYDESYSKLGDLKSSIPYPKSYSEISNYPVRVIRSQGSENNDNFRSFLENDYLDLPMNRGEIINLSVFNNILLIHTVRSLYRTKGREELVTGDFRAFLGSGDIFEIPPEELFNTKYGFAGIQDVSSAVETKSGYFFIDSYNRRPYLFTDNIDDLAEKGMRNFFHENLKWYIDEVEDHNNIPACKMISEYDSRYNRILFTKTDYKPTPIMILGVKENIITLNNTSKKYQSEYNFDVGVGVLTSSTSQNYIDFSGSSLEDGYLSVGDYIYSDNGFIGIVDSIVDDERINLTNNALINETSVNWYYRSGQTIGMVTIEYSNEDFFEDKSFTLSYMPEINAWVSFHSYRPDFYMSDGFNMYSFKDDKFYIHNSDNVPAMKYYENQESMHFQFVDNREPVVTKSLMNLEYNILTVGRTSGKIVWNENFDRFRIRNDIQDSDIQNILYFSGVNGNARKIESTWRINKFRDFINPTTGLIDLTLPWYKQKKFIGKYAIIDLYYDNNNDVKLSLISANCNFKESNR